MFCELLCYYNILKAWKKNPKLHKKELPGWSSWKEDIPENNKPLTAEEVRFYKNFLRKHAISSYKTI